jgi:Uri superfamily endonuclease
LRGNYVLVLNAERTFKAQIGSLGEKHLERGIYLYVGSALGIGSTSIESRLERHRTKDKKVFWHIDYLTVRPYIKVSAAYYVESDSQMECELKKEILERLGGKVALPNFGSTDCRCGGHLIYLGGSWSIDRVAERIAELRGYALKPLRNKQMKS